MAERISTGDAQLICEALRTAYANGVIGIFGGATQPADANDAETGNLLCLLTDNGGAFTPGTATNGLTFEAPTGGVLSKTTAQVWSGVGLPAAGSSGTLATYYRHYDNSYTTGASTTAKRFDGAISTSSLAEMQLSVATIVDGAPVTITNYTRTPART